MKALTTEIPENERFAFGENWLKFIELLNDDRILEAESSLKNMLNVQGLSGKTFLDIGCGSGLFSLAAKRLGAKVHSFDFDQNSVLATKQLKKKYFENDPNWIIEKGSVLDKAYLISLGSFDYVYSWGVLHHTGDMWKALENTRALINPHGKIFIAIYNDQGFPSKIWYIIKLTYVRLPKFFRFLVIVPSFIRLWGPRTLIDLLKGKPFHTWKNYKSNRGMSPWRDVIDWVGGYPFQVAKPEDIFNLFSKDNFNLIEIRTCAGKLGCNEFVFQKF